MMAISVKETLPLWDMACCLQNSLCFLVPPFHNCHPFWSTESFLTFQESHMSVSSWHCCEYKGMPASSFSPVFFPQSHCWTEMIDLWDTGLGEQLPGCCSHSSAGLLCPVSNTTMTTVAELVGPSRRWGMILELMWWQEMILELMVVAAHEMPLECCARFIFKLQNRWINQHSAADYGITALFSVDKTALPVVLLRHGCWSLAALTEKESGFN